MGGGEEREQLKAPEREVGERVRNVARYEGGRGL